MAAGGAAVHRGSRLRRKGNKLEMKEVEILTKIRIKDNGEILTETAAGTPDHESDEAAGYTIESDDDLEVTEAEEERYAVASDLADVCDYLSDSEVIKIRLFIQKAQARKERGEERAWE